MTIIVRSPGDVPVEEVTAYGSTKTTIEWLITKKDKGASCASMRRFVIQPGGQIGVHHHPYEHEIYIISGRGELIDENGVVATVKPEDVVFIPPDVHHGYRVVGDEPLKFICVIPHPKD